MPITIQLPDGQRREFRHDPITVGRGPGCQIWLPDETHLRDEHARIRKIAGRWLVESLGDWPIQAGVEQPARLAWLRIGDPIRLSQDGPELVFEPAREDVVLDSVAPRVTQTRTDWPAPFSEPSPRDRIGIVGPSPLPPTVAGGARTIPPPLPSRGGRERQAPPLSDRAALPRSTPPPLPGIGRVRGSGPQPLPDEGPGS
jgi:hypothetical protein